MPGRVRITDVSPRDGLQNEAAVIPTADKVALIEALCETGMDEIEITSFVSPKWVPQLGDAEEVCAGVREFAEAVRHVWGTMPGSRESSKFDLPVFSALVPNEKGFGRALAVCESGLPLKISVFTAASETFSQKNTNASIAESIERFRAFVPRALAQGIEVRAYISCAVACPFEGPVSPGAVRRVADSLLGLASNDDQRNALELDLGDTIGVATEQDIERLLGAFDDTESLPLTLHLHDTFGRAADCVAVALEMGVRSFDGSVAGLGGCPYASTPEKRAPGNISTESLVSRVWQEGYDTGVDESLLAQVGQTAREMIARARAGGAS